MNNVEWFISNPDKNGNVYYCYPKLESDFKDGVIKAKGMYLCVLDKNDKEIYNRSTSCKSTVLKSPILTYIKTIKEKGVPLYIYFKDKKIYSVPENLKHLLEKNKA